jgi:hypothetical protein
MSIMFRLIVRIVGIYCRPITIEISGLKKSCQGRHGGAAEALATSGSSDPVEFFNAVSSRLLDPVSRRCLRPMEIALVPSSTSSSAPTAILP